MKIIYILIIVSVILNINGCAKSHSIKIIETIPNVSVPSWVNNTKEFWQDKDNFYYRGTTEGTTRIEESKRIATASARIKIAEQIKNEIKSDFIVTIQANSDTTDLYIKDIFISKVDGIVITGSTIVESYLQKIQESTKNEREKIYYRCYILMQISKKDYEKTAKMAFEDTTNQLADDNKIALTQKIEKNFWELYNTKNNK